MEKVVEGFKNERDLKIFENRLAEINPTCYLVWKVGVNLALRVSDVLKITVDEAKKYIKTGIYRAKDKKTSKDNQIKINEKTLQAFKQALELREKAKVSVDNPYLFVGEGNRTSNSKSPISRQAVDKYFKKAVDDENLDINIGTHTMRKTWGCVAYAKGYKVDKIMKRLNHSSQDTTLLYIGITDKEMDDMTEDLNI